MTGNCLMPGPRAFYLPQNPVTQMAKICVLIMMGSSLFTGSRLSAPKTLAKKSVSITTASIIKPAPYLVSEISNIPTHPAMRPTVESIQEEDDAPSTAPLVNTPYIVEQLFPVCRCPSISRYVESLRLWTADWSRVYVGDLDASCVKKRRPYLLVWFASKLDSLIEIDNLHITPLTIDNISTCATSRALSLLALQLLSRHSRISPPNGSGSGYQRVSETPDHTGSPVPHFARLLHLPPHRAAQSVMPCSQNLASPFHDGDLAAIVALRHLSSVISASPGRASLQAITIEFQSESDCAR
ncbi:hypothetical protein C8R44DRAFT_853024 [Mycena epipterygia]|nr:hypothetical protein C8R44DRAFT_853024 [Mycena epipterygia]